MLEFSDGAERDYDRFFAEGEMNYGFKGGFNLHGDLNVLHQDERRIDGATYFSSTLHALYKNDRVAAGAFVSGSKTELEERRYDDGFLVEGDLETWMAGGEFAWMFNSSTIQAAIGAGSSDRTTQHSWEEADYYRNYSSHDDLAGFNVEYRIFVQRDLRVDVHVGGLGYVESFDDYEDEDDMDVYGQYGFDVEWRPGRLPFSIEAGYDWFTEASDSSGFNGHIFGVTLRYNFGPNDSLRVRERNGATFDPVGGFALFENL